jgi:hypothetical protein
MHDNGKIKKYSIIFNIIINYIVVLLKKIFYRIDKILIIESIEIVVKKTFRLLASGRIINNV